MKTYILKWILFMMAMCSKNSYAGVKAVLFDCDGTLVDSEYAHYLGFQHALVNLGSDLALEDYYQYVGNSAEKNAQLLAERIGQDCSDLILQMKRDYYQVLCQAGLPPILATVHFLKELAARKEVLGIKIGVCSAAKRVEILAHLASLQVDHLLDIVLSGQEDLVGYSDPEGVNKPKPYIYLHAMKQLGVEPADTVVIEDSAPGVAAGVAAGCFTIAIPNDYTRNHVFNNADLHLESLQDINVSGFLQTVLDSSTKK